MTKVSQSHRSLASQHGAVLVTSLLLMLVMTMLGVTAMRTATMEERMAANSSFGNRSFQAAESAVAAAFDDDGPFTSSMGTAGGGTASVTVTNLDDAINSSATVTHLDFDENPPCPGNSMGVGKGNTFENQYFEIEATGALEAGSETLARSTITAGVAYCVPAG